MIFFLNRKSVQAAAEKKQESALLVSAKKFSTLIYPGMVEPWTLQSKVT
jgi:hypothetical protein